MKIAGIEVGEACLGTMYFGTRVPERAARHVMDVFAELGGCFLDTANKYASWVDGFCGGESETLIGRWLKGRPRDRFVIASKVGFAYGTVDKGLNRRQIVSECEKSLRRLRTDCIDLYFAHSQDEQTPVEESLAAFDELIRAGKVRRIGASNYDAWRLFEAAQAARELGVQGYACLQQRYSLLQPVVGADFGTQKILTPEHLGFCRRQGLTVMAYSPLLGGLYEQADPEFPVQYDTRGNRDRLGLLREHALRSECPPSRLVCAWLREEGIVPVVATGNADHLRTNLLPMPGDAAPEFAEALRNLNRIDTKY